MPAFEEAILLLGGTGEATALARRIAERWPERRLTVSLAGRTHAPTSAPGEIRIGGFGSVAGLEAFLRAERIGCLIDATHPFAAQISAHAAEAAKRAGIPRLALLRPAWTREAGDDWRDVPSLDDARDALPAGARPFLALGRQHLAAFTARPDLRPLLRMVDPPQVLPLKGAEVIVGKPSADAREEEALMQAHGATHLVCRNSGGAGSYAKIAAARALGLPVIIIARPVPPEPPVVSTPAAVMNWLATPRPA